MIIVHYIEDNLPFSPEMRGRKYLVQLRSWQSQGSKERYIAKKENKREKMSFYNGEQAQYQESEVPRFHQLSMLKIHAQVDIYGSARSGKSTVITYLAENAAKNKQV